MKHLPHDETPGMRRCQGPCGEEMPLDERFFPRSKHYGGFKLVCNTCLKDGADSRKEVRKMPEGMRLCQGPCGMELPANTDHFDSDSSNESRLRKVCKKCRKEKREAIRLQRAADYLYTLDKTLVNNILKAKPGGQTLPHQAELYQILMTMMGGVQGWGMHWMAQYTASPPGSQTRERMLGQIQKLAAAVSDSNKVQMPAELMSDEDLTTELLKRDERMRVVPINIENAKESA
jgi:hypothetical protein